MNMKYRIKRVRMGGYTARDSKLRRVFGLSDYIRMNADGTTVSRTFTNWVECIRVMQSLNKCKD